MPIVGNFNANSIVNNIIVPQLTTSVVDVMNSDNSSNMLDLQSIISNNCIDIYSDEKLNDHPITLQNNASNNIGNKLSEKLRLLFVQFKVSHNFCNSLLTVLRNEGLDVPKDIRTLMKTPTNHEIINISGGSYIHLGLKNMLLPILSRNNAQIYINSHIIKIGINIDGLPISKSSKSQLWPILISILNFKELKENVIPVGIFHGFQKPQSIEEFMNPFIIDLLEMVENGLTVNEILFNIQISNISCDSPAKAFLLNVKSHNAYSGCTSCIEEGTYLDHRMTYPGLNSLLRTDESFRNKNDEDYHKGNSPLTRLPINIINTVALDYMHNVCLGVVKRLIEFWVRGNKEIRLEKERKDKINNELKNLRPYVPSELCRLPRAIDEIEYYKATELRTFLLYSGPIVLKGNLKKKFYFHFLLLVYAIRILICAETCCKYNEIASQLLKQFVNDFSILYGPHLISYNVHSLIHLPMYVLIHGPLDNFSCFRYENYLQEIKKSIKSIKYPLQEIFNRIMEKQSIDDKLSSQLFSQHPIFINEIMHNISLPHFKLSDKLFEKIIFPYSDTTINILKEKDRYIMLHNNILVSVQHIVQSQNKPAKLIVKQFLNCSEFTSVPLSSFKVGLYFVNISKMSEMFSINLTDIKCKCFFIRLSNGLAFISSLSHTVSFI